MLNLSHIENTTMANYANQNKTEPLDFSKQDQTILQPIKSLVILYKWETALFQYLNTFGNIYESGKSQKYISVR